MTEVSVARPVGLDLRLAFRGAVGRLIEPETWVLFPIGVTASVIMALVEREQSRLGAADRALSGAALGVALPLLAYWVSERMLAKRRLAQHLLPIVRHGGRPASAAFGLVLALTSTLALGGAALGGITAATAHGFRDGPWIIDSLTSAWVGSLGGMVYATCFLSASSFGKRGGGRLVFLALDGVLGLSNGVLAIPWPRTHIRSLLGGEPPLGLSQSVSLLILLLVLLMGVALALRRARR